MRKLIVALFVLGIPLTGSGQIKLQEGFESADSVNLPPGWTKWNLASFPIDPESHWLVQDTGRSIVGLATALTVAHSGSKAIRTSWIAGVDTITSQFLQSDVWLVTKRIVNIEAGDSLVFWATGGNPNYLDSLQIWIDGTDSIPGIGEYHMASIIWPAGSVYGRFTRYAYDLSFAVGFTIWIGFRYYMDVAIDGFCVHVDDVQVGRGLSSVQNTDTRLPETFELMQNYPNPFNPGTIIEYALPTAAPVSLTVYDLLGRVVAQLVNERKDAGVHRVEWRATDNDGLASGVYLYQLRAGEFVRTKKLLLLR